MNSFKIIEITELIHYFFCIAYIIKLKLLADSTFHDRMIRFNMAVLLRCGRFCKFLNNLFIFEILLNYFGDEAVRRSYL